MGKCTRDAYDGLGMVRFRSRSDDGFGFELSCFTWNVSGFSTTAVHTFAALVWTEQSCRLHRRYCGRMNPLLSTSTETAAESVLASYFTDASSFRRAAWKECKAKLCWLCSRLAKGQRDW